MAVKQCFTIHCTTHGDIDWWQDEADPVPTGCPLDGGHTVSDPADRVAGAATGLHLLSPGGKVFELIVDEAGVLSTSEKVNPT